MKTFFSNKTESRTIYYKLYSDYNLPKRIPSLHSRASGNELDFAVAINITSKGEELINQYYNEKFKFSSSRILTDKYDPELPIKVKTAIQTIRLMPGKEIRYGFYLLPQENIIPPLLYT